MTHQFSDLKLTKGFFSHGVYNLTPRESFEYAISRGCIVDVREHYMTNFKMFKSESVIYLPFSELGRSFNSLPDNRLLVIADSTGLKSREAVLFLTGKGYTNVVNMAGGFVEWERDGLPVTTDKSYRLSGSCACQLKPREKK